MYYIHEMQIRAVVATSDKVGTTYPDYQTALEVLQKLRRDTL